MTARPVEAPAEPAPLPARGERVVLDGLPGGPWPTVVERLGAGRVVVAAPRRAGRPARLPAGRPFVLAYWWREAPCEVAAVLAEERDAGGGYVARTDGTPLRLQRRGAVRVPVSLIARTALGGEPGASVAAVTENLSAGGALLRMPWPVEPGRGMALTLDAGGAGPVPVPDARVVRCDRVARARRPWRIAVAFGGLPPAAEDALVRLVFRRQREMLRERREGAG